MRYHLIPVRIAIKLTNKSQRGCGKRENLLHCWWEQPPWKVVSRYFKILKMDLPFVPVIPLLGMYPEESQTLIQKNINNPLFIAALFKFTKIWKQTTCPSIDEQIKQLWEICTKEYYSNVKKKKILAFGTVWINPEKIMLSEISQSEKNKYHVISLICRI